MKWCNVCSQTPHHNDDSHMTPEVFGLLNQFWLLNFTEEDKLTTTRTQTLRACWFNALNLFISCWVPKFESSCHAASLCITLCCTMTPCAYLYMCAHVHTHTHIFAPSVTQLPSTVVTLSPLWSWTMTCCHSESLHQTHTVGKYSG